VNGQSGRQKGKHSEPPPKDSANAKAVDVYLEDSCSLFLLLPIDPLFSTAELVLLVTVISSQRVSLRSSHQQLIFQTRFTAKNCSLISSASLLSSARGAVGAASMNSPRL
jgi:hypothetical protein